MVNNREKTAFLYHYVVLHCLVLISSEYQLSRYLYLATTLVMRWEVTVDTSLLRLSRNLHFLTSNI